jgi:uncharacterized damage-inducible protein DinB
MKSHFQMFARYNQWANRALYDAAALLTDAQYRENRGAFFGSVHGTLNHLLTTDRVWFQRIIGNAETGAVPDRLDAILFEDFAGLREARVAEDARIIAYLDGLSDAAYAGSIRYRRVSTPDEFDQKLIAALAHVFNHQTHHRGQAHALLTAHGQAGPVLDLLQYQRLADKNLA